MTKKEAFRLGFLSRMAERGMTPSQFEKQAGSGVAGESIELIGRLSPIALAALVGIPAATGILTGWGHAGLTDVSEEDVERIKKRDFVDTYRSEAQRIRRKLQRGAYKEPKRRKAAPEEF